MTDEYPDRVKDGVEKIAAAAWAAGFVAAHNMDRGYGLQHMATPVSRHLWEDIDAWNPFSGEGTTDPYEVVDD